MQTTEQVEAKKAVLPTGEKSIEELAKECATMIKEDNLQGAVDHAVANTKNETEQAKLSELVDSELTTEETSEEKEEVPTPPEAA